MRAESLAKQEIPSIPAAAIEPFLSRPLVIEPDGLDKAPTIVATQADRVMRRRRAIAPTCAASAARRKIPGTCIARAMPLVDPDTNQTLGLRGDLSRHRAADAAGDPATVVLTSAVQEVGAGDKLVAAGRPQPVNYAPHAPSASI